MSDAIIQKLTESFMRFPGIGPRQAQRFVYYLLHVPPGIAGQLLKQIEELRRHTGQCVGCYRFYSDRRNDHKKLCELCADSTRERELLMLVEKDIDLENVEKSGTYRGRYFVLGGLVKILDQQPDLSIRAKELTKTIDEGGRGGQLKEIIVALSANLEGDATIDFLRNRLAPLLARHNLKFSTLGRGLSTGVEVEYSDADTLKNALKNRQ